MSMLCRCVRGSCSVSRLHAHVIAPLTPAAALTWQRLLDQGASLTVRNYKDGKTPLHTAAIYNRAEATEMLIAAGAPYSMPTTSGRTALDLAKQEKWKNVERVLKRHEQRLLSEGRDVAIENDAMVHAPDPRVAIAEGREPHLRDQGQETYVLPTMLTAAAAFLFPYLLFLALRSARKRQQPRSGTARVPPAERRI